MLASPIYLVRHAETTLNAAEVVQHPDTPLSVRGRWQAEQLAVWLRDEGVGHVASSDYIRARTTAETICDATQTPLTLDPIFRERNLGELRGRPYSEVREDVFSDTYDPTDGESWPEFNHRIDAMWDRIRQLRETIRGVLAVVTHGLVCRTLVKRHLTLPSGCDTLRFPNASVTIIDAIPPWRVRVLGRDTHLDTHETTSLMGKD